MVILPVCLVVASAEIATDEKRTDVETDEKIAEMAATRVYITKEEPRVQGLHGWRVFKEKASISVTNKYMRPVKSVRLRS